MKNGTQLQSYTSVFKAWQLGGKKTILAGQVMYRAVGYITARSRFKTSWGPAKKVSEQYLQPNG